MRPGLYRQVMTALRTGIYAPGGGDVGKVAETMMELSDEEQLYIWDRLESWERAKIKQMEQMYGDFV